MSEQVKLSKKKKNAEWIMKERRWVNKCLGEKDSGLRVRMSVSEWVSKRWTEKCEWKSERKSECEKNLVRNMKE